MSVETIARRYATALADIVVSKGNSQDVKNELDTWQNLISSNNDLQTAFANPSIAHLSKKKVLESLIGRTQPSPTTANFLRILLRNSRLTELQEINTKFASVLEERSGVMSGSVVSARELGDKEKAGFAENLKKITGKDVKLTFTIDENLIGGAVTRVGSTVYDGSVRSRLLALKEQMVQKK
jgi:F-type H+-transporting ATPase subunit delta